MPANVSLQSGASTSSHLWYAVYIIILTVHTTATLQLCTTFHMNIMKEPGCCVDAKYPASFPRTEDTRPQTGDKDRLPDHKPEETCSYHSVTDNKEKTLPWFSERGFPCGCGLVDHLWIIIVQPNLFSRPTREFRPMAHENIWFIHTLSIIISFQLSISPSQNLCAAVSWRKYVCKDSAIASINHGLGITTNTSSGEMIGRPLAILL